MNVGTNHVESRNSSTDTSNGYIREDNDAASAVENVHNDPVSDLRKKSGAELVSNIR